MYTERPRVALAVLHTDLTTEQEMRLLLPAEVAVYANRVVYPPEVTVANLELALAGLEECVGALAGVRPHALVWACTSGSVISGPPGHLELLGRLRDWAPGASVMTAASAVLDSLAALGASRVAVATPYPPAVSARLREVLEDAGHEVVSLVPLFPGPVDDWTLQGTPPERIGELASEADHPDAEAVFVSCTGLAAATVANEVEARLGKPFLTSNLAIARRIQAALEEVAA